jgi:hypothetical protein
LEAEADADAEASTTEVMLAEAELLAEVDDATLEDELTDSD